MEKVEELKEQINRYIIELILNSDVEKDWNNELIKDNIIISAYDDKFNILFRGQKMWDNYEFDIYPIKFSFSFLFNKKLRVENRKMRRKLKEILYYKDKKTELRKLKEIANNLPLKFQRKEKLDKLNES